MTDEGLELTPVGPDRRRPRHSERQQQRSWRRKATWLVQQTIPELRRQHEDIDEVDARFGTWNDDVEVKDAADTLTCKPPPIFIPLVTIAQIVSFIIYAAKLRDVTFNKGGVEFKSPLIYNPFRRVEAWRFLSYALLHDGVYHLIMNLLMQLTFGLVLEWQHKFWRVVPVYFLGTVAGCLASSVFDPWAWVVGGSGGVYAIMGAHVATVLINWREMQRGWTKSVSKVLFSGFVRLIIIFFILGSDTAVSIYTRYVTKRGADISYATHFGSFAAGVLIGVFFLRNLKIRTFEKVLCVIFAILFVGLIIAGIVFNVICADYKLCPELRMNTTFTKVH